jgi:hypothetical protein
MRIAKGDSRTCVKGLRGAFPLSGRIIPNPKEGAEFLIEEAVRRNRDKTYTRFARPLLSTNTFLK